MSFGAQIEADGKVRFQLWAPKHEHIELELLDATDGTASVLPMQRQPEGWHRATHRSGAGWDTL